MFENKIKCISAEQENYFNALKNISNELILDINDVFLNT